MKFSHLKSSGIAFSCVQLKIVGCPGWLDVVLLGKCYILCGFSYGPCRRSSVDRTGRVDPEQLDSDPTGPGILVTQTVMSLDCHGIGLINPVASSHKYGWNQCVNGHEIWLHLGGWRGTRCSHSRELYKMASRATYLITELSPCPKSTEDNMEAYKCGLSKGF